jgi:hypothetical protein
MVTSLILLGLVLSVAPRAFAQGTASTTPTPSTCRCSSTNTAEPGSRDLLDYLKDLGIPGIGGTILGGFLGAGLSRRSTTRARREERTTSALDALDAALADAARVSQALMARGDNEAGVRSAQKAFLPAYTRHATRLLDRALAERLRAVTTLLDAALVSAGGRGTIEPGLIHGMKRAVANARAGLLAASQDEPLPPDAFPASDQVAVLIRAGGDLPFEALQEWLAQNQPPEALNRFL